MGEMKTEDMMTVEQAAKLIAEACDQLTACLDMDALSECLEEVSAKLKQATKLVSNVLDHVSLTGR